MCSVAKGFKTPRVARHNLFRQVFTYDVQPHRPRTNLSIGSGRLVASHETSHNSCHGEDGQQGEDGRCRL